MGGVCVFVIFDFSPNDENEISVVVVVVFE